MPLVNSADHDDTTSVPLWPIKQRHSACLWRAPNSVTSPWYINRRRTPEITRWRRTKYAIKVTVIRADRKPICSLSVAGPSSKIPFFPPAPPPTTALPPLPSPYTFTIVLGQFSRCASPVRGTLRSFRVFKKKKIIHEEGEKIKQQKGVRRVRPAWPTDRPADRPTTGRGKERPRCVELKLRSGVDGIIERHPVTRRAKGRAKCKLNQEDARAGTPSAPICFRWPRGPLRR